MTDSFTRKKIDLEITLKEGTFGETGTSTVRLSGLRVSADIAKAGAIAMNNSSIRVWGLRQSMMNELSTLGVMMGTQIRSSVILYAGDDNGMSLVFAGDVTHGWAEYQSAPDVPFSMIVQTGQLANMKPAPALSYKGAKDVADIMAELAQRMGVKFERNGVSVILNNPNFPGTDRAKAAAAAKAARINWKIDDDTLAIWPADGARQGDVPTLSPNTGMVGYPRFNQEGLEVTCLYNPALRFGAQVKIQSSLPPACGAWNVMRMHHTLEAEMPGGQWFTNLQLSKTSYGYQQ
jgi:hypothetical protein